MKKLVAALISSLFAGMLWAGSVSGTFSVRVQLTQQQKCTSETLSQATNALVQVVCRSGNFVSIDPAPGKPFLGTQGGAFRYYFGVGSSGATPLAGADRALSPFGYGTVTGLRVFNPYGAEDPFEFVVSY
jgi:hypothetical protein